MPWWRCQSCILPNNYAHKMFKYLCKQCLGPSAAGGDCRVSLCVCVESSNLFGAMHLVSSCEIHTVALCAEFRVFLSPSICSQIDLDIYIVRFDCNTTSGRVWWGQSRAGGTDWTVDQWLLVFNQLKLWTRVTQSQATSCPICLATGRAHVPHLNISQARLPKQSRDEEGDS